MRKVNFKTILCILHCSSKSILRSIQCTTLLIRSIACTGRSLWCTLLRFLTRIARCIGYMCRQHLKPDSLRLNSVTISSALCWLRGKSVCILAGWKWNIHRSNQCKCLIPSMICSSNPLVNTFLKLHRSKSWWRILRKHRLCKRCSKDLDWTKGGHSSQQSDLLEMHFISHNCY